MEFRGLPYLVALTTALLSVGCGEDSDPAKNTDSEVPEIVGDIVHVSAAATAKGANGTLEKPYATVASAMAAIDGNEGWTGTLAIHEGIYEVLQDVVLPKGVVLKVDAGTTMKLASLKAINAQANVRMEGTAEKPILLTPLVSGQPWGAVTVYEPTAQDNLFQYVIFEYGMNSNFQGQFGRGVLALDQAKALITYCTFRYNQGDDGITLIASDSVVDHCQFLYNESDAIDQGTGHAEIRYSYAEGNKNDAWDLGDKSTAYVHHNIAYQNGDKCISVGEGTGGAIIEHNLCVENKTGVAIKDESTPIVRFNTLYNNVTGVWVFASASGYGTGKGTFTNNIVWNSTDSDFDLSSDYGTVFGYNCAKSYVTKGGFAITGAGLLSSGQGCDDPGFADPDNPDPNLKDFHLKSVTGRYVAQTGLNLLARPEVAPTWVNDPTSSPCLDKADPATDPAIVALEPLPNGGVANLGAYGGTEQASKSP